MKRQHVHVTAESRATSVGFYSALFAVEPTVRRADCAKWMLQDPRVNYAISQRGAAPGIERLGIQVENQSELQEMYVRLKRAGRPALGNGLTAYCVPVENLSADGSRCGPGMR